MFSSMLSLLGSLRRGNFVTNSLRFRSSASANLTRTPSVNGARTTWTFSCWVKRGTIGVAHTIFTARDNGNSTNQYPYGRIGFLADDTLQYQESYNGLEPGLRTTSQVFRDPSAWYHIVVALNTTLPTASERVKLYVNGSEITDFSSSIDPSGYTSIITSNRPHLIAANYTAPTPTITTHFDGYLTEVYLIDGQALTPSSFGQIESTTGVWSPKQYVGTYGTNGFYLKFSDASAATAAAIGKDSSGNGNNWTPSGISVTPGVTYDSMLDVPVNYSDSGNGRGNYAVLNPLDWDDTAPSLSDGNLKWVTNTLAGSSLNNLVRSSIYFPSSGKWYAEITIENYNVGNTGYLAIGLEQTNPQALRYIWWEYTSQSNAQINTNAGLQNIGTLAVNDVIKVAYDANTGQIWFGRNSAWYLSGDPSAGTPMSSQATLVPALNRQIRLYVDGRTGAATNRLIVNFGQRPFAEPIPTGFLPLHTNNLPTPSIVNGANFMAATAYTGNATARSLSNVVNNVSFQPDLVWIKSRTPGATSHALFDSVRGTTKYLSSDTTAAETTLAGSLTAFNADGFSLGTATAPVNTNANSYIAWQWKESITAGLDVVSYTGTGANTTIAHNLGVAPAMIIVKRSQTGATGNWQVRHTSIAAANSIQLNSSAVEAAAATVWNSTAPTSSVFSIGTSPDVNASGISYIAYCFAEIAGFSRFGTYTGNGLTNGPFVFCGFRPRWIMVKRTNNIQSWQIIDTTRNTTNAVTLGLYPHLPDIESSSGVVDILSNGFKIRSDNSSPIFNATNGIYIFAAFAEVPSKYALAR